jgi:nucleotide-binding universal stress UspA family protein
MVLTILKNPASAEQLILSAYALSVALKKTFGVIIYAHSEEEKVMKNDEIPAVLASCDLNNIRLIFKNDDESVADVCEELEASFLFIQLENNRKGTLKSALGRCRELRIPYLLWKNEFVKSDFSKVLVPVTFLEEEIEKAQFASAFGRFCHAEITIFPANDYGSKAGVTAGKMQALFEKFNLKYTLQKARQDSYKVEKEALRKAENERYDLLIISASREYGLDDILFGAKELHLVKQSPVPVLLVNPRGDLYALCD